MKSQDILNITPQKLAKMSEKELRKIASTQRSVVRKRYERLVEKDVIEYSPAGKSLHRGGLFPSVKGMDAVTLRNEIKRYNQFLKMKTSSVTGTRKHIKEMRETVREITGNENALKNDDDVLRYWRNVERLQNTELGSVLNYRDSMDATAEIMEKYSDLTDDEIIERAEKILQKVYERENPTISTYFEQ